MVMFDYNLFMFIEMCQPLESDSLDIECRHNGKYANCSNLSIPKTTAKPSCKPSYTPPYGQPDGLLELVCQSNGTWDKQLYRCIPSNFIFRRLNIRL